MSHEKFKQQNGVQTIAIITDKNKKACHQYVKSLQKFLSVKREDFSYGFWRETQPGKPQFKSIAKIYG